MRGGPTPIPVTQNRGATVGLTSSAAELQSLVDWTVSVKAEMRRGQARLRHVTGNCCGAAWKQSRV